MTNNKPIRPAIKIYLEIMRPFTLIAPSLGIISGAITAFGAEPRFYHNSETTILWIAKILIASVAASLLNAASNVLNQIYDIEIDRINKPERVLVRGEMSIGEAKVFSFALYAVSVFPIIFVNTQCFLLYLIAAIATILYSMPPFRFKRNGWIANLTIAIPRGVLLKVAGWSVTKSIFSSEAWLIGTIFGLFLFGATNSKDFADIKGDMANGCRTIPVMYGKDKTVKIIYPFYTIPFLLIVFFSLSGPFTGNRYILVALGILCTVWGDRVVKMIDRDPFEKLTENHPSWNHMYYLMFTLQTGFMIAYIF
ncbi:MAG: UbiA family prenyltransferase [Deltaproteobacteria bacterium]|nr:UbiA family prenyltransferase [Deltaproteobacteria bacterium]